MTKAGKKIITGLQELHEKVTRSSGCIFCDLDVPLSKGLRMFHVVARTPDRLELIKCNLSKRSKFRTKKYT